MKKRAVAGDGAEDNGATSTSPSPEDAQLPSPSEPISATPPDGDRARQDVGDRLERLASLGARAAEVAHELRNALAVLETSLHLVQRALAQPHGAGLARIDEHLDRMRSQVHAGQRIVREVLDEARDSALERAQIDLRALVLEVASGVEHGDAVTLVVEVESAHPNVDARQLRQLLLNLVRNAVEALGERRGIVSIGASVRGDLLELVVDDDGPGIDASVRSRLFQAFVTAKAGGTGLGLAVCKRICEAHGGSIAAEPRIPHGTRIIARLGLRAT